MPDMLTTPVPARMTWTGPELERSREWVSVFSTAELAELDAALRATQAAGLAWGSFGAADFALPTLNPRLAILEKELKDGRGFALLRGLDVTRYTVDEIRTIYWGLSVHLGTVVSQNALGTLIEDITDLAPKNLGDPNLRSYVTADAQPPHCDLADIVGLLCVDRAMEGGTSVIVSLMEIYNRMLRDKPEYLAALYEGYYHDLRGEGPTGEANEISTSPVPVFSYRNGRLRSWFHGKKIRQGALKRGVPLSELQMAALDYIERLGTDPEVRMDMKLERGDIQFLNNYMAMHYRTGFVDGAGHKRLMLRIWLELDDMGEFDAALDKWVRQGVPRQSWAQTRSLPAIGRV